MPTVKFTKSLVSNLTLPAGVQDQLYWDEGLPGFGLRLRAGGARTWLCQFRVGNKQRRFKLGPVEKLDLDQARAAARKVLAGVVLGADPQAIREEARAEKDKTFGEAADAYVSYKQSRLRRRSLEEVQRHLNVHWKPLRRTPIKLVARRKIAEQLEQIQNDHGPVAANRARTTIIGFFIWAVGTGLVDANPATGIPAPVSEKPRERVLCDQELVDIWSQAGVGDYGDIIRLLILTGQRREEVGGMLWPEVDLDQKTWTLPPARTKNKRRHVVPLSPAAAAILSDRHNAEDRDKGRHHIFGLGEGGFSGWSRAKASLDKRIAKAATDREESERRDWRLHDIRRTFVTGLNGLGVAPHIVEETVNHRGHKSGIAAVYNHFAYEVEKRNAIELWADYLRKLIPAASHDR